jgi:hypothetical protein
MVNTKIYVVRTARAEYPTFTGEWSCIAQVWPCPCEFEPFFSPPPPRKCRLTEPFIAQGRTVTMSPKARQVASRQVKPYVVEHHRPGVANDVFKRVRPVLSPASLHTVSSVVPCCCIVESGSGA